MSNVKRKNLRKVMYHGLRAHALTDKLYHIFKDKKGKEFHYTGNFRFIYPGGIYWQLVGERMNVRPESAIDMEWVWTEEDRKQYEAHKEVCKQVRLERRKQLELKRPHPDITRAIMLIKPFVNGIGMTDQERFFRYFKNQCTKRKK